MCEGTPRNAGPARQKRLCKHNKAKKGGKKGLCLYKTSFFVKFGTLAGVAQLVERDLPKVDVEGSRPFSRSKKEKPPIRVVFFFMSWEKKVSRTLEEGSAKSAVGTIVPMK